MNNILSKSWWKNLSSDKKLEIANKNKLLLSTISDKTIEKLYKKYKNE